MKKPIDEAKFGELVDDALDMVPDALWNQFENVAVVVEDRNEEEPSLLGLYEGVPLTERGWDYGGVLPDKISIYRLALCDFCTTEDELVDEIAVTVVHELAHHCGIDDEALHQMGWG